MSDLKSIGVRILRAEKRGRKTIIVFESDLYSDEVFAVNPFYDEGDKKNQLQEAIFNLNVVERSGEIKAAVGFDSCLSHFTKGHSQLHSPVNTFYLSKKDCAMNWVLTEKPEYFGQERISQVLAQWEHDQEFKAKLTNAIDNRKKDTYAKKLMAAKERYNAAMKDLTELLECGVKQ